MKKHFLAVALLVVAPALTSCMTSQDSPFASVKPAADDDAYCRANSGEAGTAAYANCRKDRDAGSIRSNSRMEQAHKNLAESMLNGH